MIASKEILDHFYKKEIVNKLKYEFCDSFQTPLKCHENYLVSTVSINKLLFCLKQNFSKKRNSSKLFWNIYMSSEIFLLSTITCMQK